MTEFADRLAAADMPVRRLADLLGVSAASVSRYRSGQQIPEDRQVPVLADVLDIPEPDLRSMLSEARAAKQEARDVPSLQDRIADLEAERDALKVQVEQLQRARRAALRNARRG